MYNGNIVEYTDGDDSHAGPNRPYPESKIVKRNFCRCCMCYDIVEVQQDSKEKKVETSFEFKDMQRYLDNSGDEVNRQHFCKECIEHNKP